MRRQRPDALFPKRSAPQMRLAPANANGSRADEKFEEEWPLPLGEAIRFGDQFSGVPASPTSAPLRWAYSSK